MWTRHAGKSKPQKQATDLHLELSARVTPSSPYNCQGCRQKLAVCRRRVLSARMSFRAFRRDNAPTPRKSLMSFETDVKVRRQFPVLISLTFVPAGPTAGGGRHKSRRAGLSWAAIVPACYAILIAPVLRAHDAHSGSWQKATIITDELMFAEYLVGSGRGWPS